MGFEKKNKVSVILPAYNTGKYILESVNSILQQSFSDFSLIVINDGSEDDTSSILQALNDPRLTVVDLPCNTKLAVARNIGMSMAQDSEYLVVMDADDVALPERLSLQVKYMDDHPDVAILGGKVRIFHEHSPDAAGISRHPADDGEIKARLILLNGTALSHPTTIVRNEFVKNNFIYYPSPMRPNGVDHEFWINCVARGAKFAALPEVVLLKRRHESNISSHSRNPEFSPIKTETRARLFGMYYPDLTTNEASRLALIFQENKNLNFRELSLAYAAAEKATNDTDSHFGESKLLLSSLIKGALMNRMKKN